MWSTPRRRHQVEITRKLTPWVFWRGEGGGAARCRGGVMGVCGAPLGQGAHPGEDMGGERPSLGLVVAPRSGRPYLFSISRSLTMPCGGPWNVFTYSGGIRMSSRRRALRALNPKTLPMIDEVRFGIEPSSKRSSL